MHSLDEIYFQQFATDARKAGVSLQDHYLSIQKSLRNETGGVAKLHPHELRGIQLARQWISPEDSCLIMGGGAGGEAAWLLQSGIGNITCLDIAEDLLETCSRDLGIQTLCADMRSTGLRDQAYDVVVTHRSLHHMFYPFETLEEFARIARKKVIIICEPVKAWVKDLVRNVRKSRVISGANIYEYQFDLADVHRYMAFNEFQLTRCIRYWETTKGKGVNDGLNLVAPFFGNRFTAVYQRMLSDGDASHDSCSTGSQPRSCLGSPST